MVDQAQKEYYGHASTMQGKTTTIKSYQKIAATNRIEEIRVLGRHGFTSAERAREEFVLSLLQGKRSLDDPDYPIIYHLWFPSPTSAPHKKITNGPLRGGLNQSQANVVEAMLVKEPPLIIAHGA